MRLQETGGAFLLALGVMAFPVRGQPDRAIDVLTDSATVLFTRAVENQFRGEYSSEVRFVLNSSSRGTDTLQGRLDLDDRSGRSQLQLKSPGGNFVWWSRNFGQEQWWKDDGNERLHRIPFRSFKRPAFGSILAFEDLINLPTGFLPEFQTCKRLSESDSTFDLSLSLKPSTLSRYGSMEVTLKKRPLVLRSINFFAIDGHKIKSLEVGEYRRIQNRYFPTSICILNGDSLSSLRLSLSVPEIVSSVNGKNTVPTASVFSQIQDLNIPQPL